MNFFWNHNFFKKNCHTWKREHQYRATFFCETHVCWFYPYRNYNGINNDKTTHVLCIIHVNTHLGWLFWRQYFKWIQGHDYNMCAFKDQSNRQKVMKKHTCNVSSIYNLELSLWNVQCFVDWNGKWRGWDIISIICIPVYEVASLDASLHLEQYFYHRNQTFFH